MVSSGRRFQTIYNHAGSHEAGGNSHLVKEEPSFSETSFVAARTHRSFRGFNQARHRKESEDAEELDFSTGFAPGGSSPKLILHPHGKETGSYVLNRSICGDSA